MLNTKLNRCIPVPGFYIPFLFLALSFAWALYLYRSYKKGLQTDKHLLLI